jgi:DNA-binding transcriptional LysR family regulator
MGANRDLYQRLSEGRLDAAIVGVAPTFLDSNWVAVPLFNDRLFLAAKVENLLRVACGEQLINKHGFAAGDGRNFVVQHHRDRSGEILAAASVVISYTNWS